MSSTTSWTDRGPQIFAVAGIAMILMAAYIGGGDQLTCQRSDRVTCEVARTRMLGRRIVEHIVAPHVVKAWVRTSTGEHQEYRQGRGPTSSTTSSNDTLVVGTASGTEVDLIGGEPSAGLAKEISSLIAGTTTAPLEFFDSYWIMAAFLGGFGLVMVAFATFARMTQQ